MRRTTLAYLLLAVSSPVWAQMAAEQLSRAVSAQETMGRLDDAISIYRQLAASALTPRDVAAQAQFRLAQALLQKGDLPNAVREFERLERSFPEAGPLISQLASQLPQGGAASRSAVHSIHITETPQGLSFPAGLPGPVIEKSQELAARLLTGAPIQGVPITATGTVYAAFWMNPISMVDLDAGKNKYLVLLASPNALLRQGMNRDSLKNGTQITVSGFLPVGMQEDGMLVAQMVTGADGKVLFDRAKLSAPPPPPPSPAR